jgi:hypothetical protein
MFLVFILIFHWTQSQAAQKTPNSASTINAEIANKLLGVKRIYVDSFGDDSQSKQLQAMVMSSLAESKKFIITENKEKADAVLKGSGLEKTSQELHATNEGTAVGAAAAGHSSSISGSVINGSGSISGSSVGGAAAKTMAIQDAQASTETVNDARLAVRLVSQDGDVIWATTKESKGAKYKGASADVAAQIVKQLMWDLEKAAKERESTTKNSN